MESFLENDGHPHQWIILQTVWKLGTVLVIVELRQGKQYNFTTGHAWDFSVIMEIKDLLQELSKEQPEQWSTSFI